MACVQCRGKHLPRAVVSKVSVDSGVMVVVSGFSAK